MSSCALKACFRLLSRLTSSKLNSIRLSWPSCSSELSRLTPAQTISATKSETEARGCSYFKKTSFLKAWRARISKSLTSKSPRSKERQRTHAMTITWPSFLRSLMKQRSVQLKTCWTCAYRPPVLNVTLCKTFFKASISLLQLFRHSLRLTFTITIPRRLIWRSQTHQYITLCLASRIPWTISTCATCRQIPSWWTSLLVHLTKIVRQ